jgi:hypothetical protein
VATPERVERFPCAAPLSLYNDNDSFALLYIFLNILNISINLWPKIGFFSSFSSFFISFPFRPAADYMAASAAANNQTGPQK